MKILYHHRTQGKGVEGIHIREIVNALKALKHDVFLVSPPGIDPFASQINAGKGPRRAANGWSMVARSLPQIFFEITELLYNFSAFIMLKKVLSREKIDFIYERYHFFGWMGTFLARRFGIPVILEVNEVSELRRVRGQALPKAASFIEKKVFKNADAIIVVSSFLKKVIREKYGLEEGKIFVVPNAINPRDFNDGINDNETRKRLGLEDKLVMGFVGKFVKWDRLEFLIEVFSNLVIINKDARLLLVGDGDNIQDLKNHAQKLSLQDKVIFPGYVARKDVYKYISAMDICVLPHSNDFGSPVVLFEYMFMTKPVAAPSLAPILDVINDGENGVLFEPENKVSFEMKLRELMDNPSKRGELGGNAHRAVLNGHLWEFNAKKIIAIYNSFAEKNK